MSWTMRPPLRWAAVSWSRVTPQRFIQYSTALRSERSSRSLSMKPRLSLRPATTLPLQPGLGLARSEGGVLLALELAAARRLGPGVELRLLEAQGALDRGLVLDLGGL